jgi:acyl-CoA dehydrogenase
MTSRWAITESRISAMRLTTLKHPGVSTQVGAVTARDEIAMSKFFGDPRLNRVLDRAFQVHGALGFSGDLPLEHRYCAARTAHLYDGPDEVHRISLARHTLRGYQSVELPSEHIPTRRAAALVRHPGASARH